MIKNNQEISAKREDENHIYFMKEIVIQCNKNNIPLKKTVAFLLDINDKSIA
jgi:hypothetical protein